MGVCGMALTLGGLDVYRWNKYEVVDINLPYDDENTILLLHGNAIVDSSKNTKAIINAGAVVSADQSKFGGKSLYFNGASSLSVEIPVSGDMTMDCWLYIQTRTTLAPTPIAYFSGNYRGLYLHAGATADGNSSFGYTLSNGNYGWANYTPITTGVWHHIAIVRRGSTMYGFLDGILTQTVSGVITTNDKIVLGTLLGVESSCWFKGYIDELRVSNVARWTKSFTPPVEEYAFVGVDKGAFLGSVISTRPDAYPNGGVQDGYYYERVA